MRRKYSYEISQKENIENLKFSSNSSQFVSFKPPRAVMPKPSNYSYDITNGYSTIPPYGYPKRKIYQIDKALAANGQMMVSYNGILTKNALVQTVGNGYDNRHCIVLCFKI